MVHNRCISRAPGTVVFYPDGCGGCSPKVLIDVESRRAFEDILEEMARASVLIEDRLTLARTDFEFCSKSLETVEFGSIVKDVCEMAHAQAQARELAFTYYGDFEQPNLVLGDYSACGGWFGF